MDFDNPSPLGVLEPQRLTQSATLFAVMFSLQMGVAQSFNLEFTVLDHSRILTRVE